MDEPKSEQRQPDELISEYANNTFIEPMAWDIKILSGELAARSNNHVDWHTAITLPWAHAKLFSYFLQLHIAVFEAERGKIAIPPAMLPKSPEGLDDTFKNDAAAKQIYDLVVEFHNVS